MDEEQEDRRRDGWVLGACVVLAAIGVSAMFLCAAIWWRLFIG